ncbi:Nn.00g035680.m01.CDS01 [Neocucurbitaria sp. VM-36]
MTEVMAQRGLGLSAPASRQDIVSALLNDYGNSFGHDDTSPSAYSPVPASKELPPPPPPRADSLRNKPLPAVQRMSMKFQLRVDEDAPLSPNGSRETPRQQSRRRIVMRSLSRGSKPASLKLTISNGSTATIPPTPALPAPTQHVSSFEAAEEKDLPPPPPEKSIRRKSVKQPAQQRPKSAKDLARNDSLLSPNKTKAAVQVSSEVVDTSPIVKRKAVPTPAAKKFTSLAELGNGPRGGKGGPMPRTSAQRKASVDSQVSEVPQSDSSLTSEETIKPEVKEQVPNLNQLPPTPEEEKPALPPAPPRKVFTGVGLPSNPRAKGPASPLHVRGKSSTGFNILKAHRPAPPIPTVNVDTITPEMTPSPKSRPDEARRGVESPLPPLPPASDQRRPFSFEARPEPQKEAYEQQQLVRPTTASAAAPPPSKSLAQVIFPLRTTSLDSPGITPSNAAPTPMAPELLDSPPSSVPTSPTSATQSPPPFTPLTRLPIPLPTRLLPQIAHSQFHCYTSHKTNIWSNNSFQPMACMVCRSNEREKSWTCTWCQLRICRACSEELSMIPGRDLRVLVKAKKELEGRDEGNPGIVVSDADEDSWMGGSMGWVKAYKEQFRKAT